VKPPLHELERVIDGELVAGDELTTSRAPKPFNARFDEAIPLAVVRCTSPGDVAETISFIRRHRLRSATRSGGHCLAGRSTTTGILIDVSPMRTVSVGDCNLTIGAGAVLGEVYPEAVRQRRHDRRRLMSIGRDRRSHARWWARDPGPHVRRDL
jgi:FAD/FMN-containing dehydrogenase